MARNQKDFTYDANLLLKDAGLVAASAAAQVGGSNKVLDLGANRMDARVVLDFTAIEVDTGDERYDILVQVSDSSTFASTIFNAGAIVVGHSSTSLESVSTAAPCRREITVSNEISGTVRRYLRLYTRVVGTIATGINYTGYLVQSPGF